MIALLILPLPVIYALARKKDNLRKIAILSLLCGWIPFIWVIFYAVAWQVAIKAPIRTAPRRWPTKLAAALLLGLTVPIWLLLIGGFCSTVIEYNTPRAPTIETHSPEPLSTPATMDPTWKTIDNVQQYYSLPVGQHYKWRGTSIEKIKKQDWVPPEVIAAHDE
jgi:hypothetical protein